MKKPVPVVKINCQTTQSQITVGNKVILQCPLPQNTASQAEWIKPEKLKNYELVFLGSPQIQNGFIKQEFTSYKTGEHQFAQLQLKLGEQVFTIEDWKLIVQSVLPPQQQGQPEPTPVPNENPLELSAPWWWWAIWGTLAALVFVIAYRKIKKWMKQRQAEKLAQAPKRILSAKEKFLLAIQKLESQEFHLKGEYKKFALELTVILKKSMGEKFKFNAEDMTTEEFFETLEKKQGLFWRENQGQLKEIFANLDQIKFAKVQTTAEGCSSLIDKSKKVGNHLFRGEP